MPNSHDAGYRRRFCGSPRRRWRDRARSFIVFMCGASAMATSLAHSVVVSGEAGGQAMSQVALIPAPQPWDHNDGFVVAVDDRARRVFVTSTYISGGGSKLTVYDADTGGLITRLPAPTGTGFQFGLYAIDPVHHRLFLGAGGIWVYNTADLQQSPRSLAPLPHGAQGGTAGGLYYSPLDDLLYTVEGTGSSLNLDAVDPATGAELWWTSVSTCSKPLNNWKQVALGQSRDGRYLYTVCRFASAAEALQPALGTHGPAGVVRITLPAERHKAACSGAPSLPPGGCQFAAPTSGYAGLTPGRANVSESVWLPSVDRMVTAVPTDHGAGWATYVFDGPTTSYVASPPLFQPSTESETYEDQLDLTADPTTGRVFAEDYSYTVPRDNPSCARQVPGSAGFAIVEGAELGNASVHSAAAEPGLAGFDRGIGFDPVRRNLWMIDMSRQDTGCSAHAPAAAKHYYVAVYHDEQAPVTARPSVDPDSPTSDQPEQQGSTGVSLGIQASSFGARYELGPSGVEGLGSIAVDNKSIGTLTCTPQDAYSALFTSIAGVFHNLPSAGGMSEPAPPPLPAQYHAACHAGLRQVTFAHVPTVLLDASEARATAVAADTDRASAQDLFNASDLSRPGGSLDDEVGYVNGVGGTGLPAPCAAGRPTVQDACGVPAPATCAPEDPTGQTTCDARDPRPYLSGEAFPFPPAGCQDSGSGSDQQQSQGTAQLGTSKLRAPGTVPGEALVQCDLVGASRAFGAASANDANVGNVGMPVFAHRAWSDATAMRTTAGAGAAADAVAEGIDVAGLLHIGRLEMHATARAHGRPGTTASNLTCTVNDVILALPGQGSAPAPPAPSGVPLSATGPAPVPSQVTAGPVTVAFPGTTSCWDPQLQADIQQLNAQLAGTMSIEFPEAPRPRDVRDRAESDLWVVEQATPRGYLAQVQVSELRQLQNAVLLSDPSVEQPGMVVTVFADSAANRDRFVATFGGVAVRASYGIYSLDGGGGPTVDCTATGDCGGKGVAPTAGPPQSSSIDTPQVTSSDVGGARHVRNTPHRSLLGQIMALPGELVDGFRFLWQHPGLIPPLLAVWAALVMPWYLASRRRTLAIATEVA